MAAVGAMAGTPLAIALLFVNVGFLGFAAYVLGEVAENARVRNKTQTELIAQLVSDIRDCRQGPKPTSSTLDYPPSFPMKMTDRGRKLLMEREGCKLKAYKDSVGVWTIGVGHTSGAGPPQVRAGMTITQARPNTSSPTTWPSSRTA